MQFIIVLTVIIFAVLFYLTLMASRSKTYEKIAMVNRCYVTDNDSIQNEVSGHGMEIFRKRDAQVKIGLEGNVDGGKIYLADLSLHVIMSDSAASAMIAGNGKYRRYGRTPSGNSSIPNGMATACFVVSKSLTLPNAVLYPETLIEKGFALLGGQDIDFDKDPVFSDRFTLQGPSEVNIRDYFKKELRSKLCQLIPSGMVVELGEECFAIYTTMPASYSTCLTLMKVGRDLYSFLKQYEPIYDED